MKLAQTAVPTSGEDSTIIGVLTRFRRVAVLLGVAIILVLGWRGREPVGITTADELMYVSLSKSLETGSYRETFLATEPFHAKYPPGYPAWLALVRAVGGEDHNVIRAANLLLLGVFVLCLYGLVRRIAGVPLALAAVLLVALNPTILQIGGTLLSESLFLALVGASLLCTVRAGPNESRFAMGAIGFATAAALTRTAGLPLLLGIGLWLWDRRRIRELTAYAATCLVAVGGWMLYVVTISASSLQSGRTYGTDIAGGLGLARPGILERMLGGAWRKAVAYGTESMPWSLGLPTVPGTVIDNAAWLVVIAVLLGVGFVLLWRKARAVAANLLFSMILILAWPWQIDRLLVPLVPFWIVSVLLGLRWLVTPLPRAWQAVTWTVLLGLMGYGALRGSLARDARLGRCDRDHPYASAACYSEEARTVAAASSLLRAAAPPGAIVMTVDPPGVNYLTGLRTEWPQILGGLRGEAAARVLRARKIQYVLFATTTGHDRKQVGQALLESCRELRLYAKFPTGGFLLTTDTSAAPGGDACPVLRDFALPPESDPLR